MKIAISYSKINMTLVNLAASLVSINEEMCVAWIPEQKPISDMLIEKRPDVLLIDSRYITPHLCKIRPELKTKIVLFGLGGHENLNPDLICLPPNTSENLIKKISFPTIIISNAANTAQFYNKQTLQTSPNSILYISEQNISSEQFRILQTISNLKTYDFKIIGHVKIPLPEYLGHVRSVHELYNVMKSCEIAIDFDDLFLYEYIINKKLVISTTNNIIGLEPATPYNIQNQIYEQIAKREYYMKNILYLKKQILEKHTYYHRLIDIFKLIGFSGFIPQIEEKLESIS